MRCKSWMMDDRCVNVYVFTKAVYPKNKPKFMPVEKQRGDSQEGGLSSHTATHRSHKPGTAAHRKSIITHT